MTQDVAVGETENLVVTAVVGNASNAAGAAGDVSIQVFPILDDAVQLTPDAPATVIPIAITASDTGAAVLSANRAYTWGRFKVGGFYRVQIQVKNNNASAKPVEISYQLG